MQSEQNMIRLNRLTSARRMGAIAALVASAIALPGCKSFSPDGGMGLVAGVAHTEVGKDVVAIRSTEDAIWAQDETTAALLKKPLSADTSVPIALLNHGLQAAYNELGIAEAA